MCGKKPRIIFWCPNPERSKPRWQRRPWSGRRYDRKVAARFWSSDSEKLKPMSVKSSLDRAQRNKLRDIWSVQERQESACKTSLSQSRPWENGRRRSDKKSSQRLWRQSRPQGEGACAWRSADHFLVSGSGKIEARMAKPSLERAQVRQEVATVH